MTMQIQPTAVIAQATMLPKKRLIAVIFQPRIG
jgi:hypothetical protein